MKRNDYYPKSRGPQPEWHTHFAAKFAQYGPGFGYSPLAVNNGVADNLTLAYGLGNWITTARELGPTCTDSLDLLRYGTGGTPFVFPTYTAATPPTLPAGADPVLPGALERTFMLVQEIKHKPGYTQTIGLDMGIVGSEETVPPPGDVPPPRITVTVIAGDEQENVRLKFVKDGHQSVEFQSRRGNGAWETLDVYYKSPGLDDRALLNPAQAEVREYRARYRDNNQPTSEWSDVAKVTVSP
jgi:hypothetical protein